MAQIVDLVRAYAICKSCGGAATKMVKTKNLEVPCCDRKQCLDFALEKSRLIEEAIAKRS